MFQSYAVFPHMSVEKNIAYGLRKEKTPGKEIARRVDAMLELVQLGDLRARKPDQLSHGEKQRAAICRALLVEPRLILADEPTGNLDPANKDRILDLLIHHAEEAHATLLVVTHDLSLLERFDHVIDFRHYHHEGAL